MDGLGAEVDLSRVTYLDSAGINALFRAARERELSLRLPPDSTIRRVVEIARLGEAARIIEGDGGPAAR